MLYEIVIPLFLLFVPWLLVRFVFATQISQHMGYRQALPFLLPVAGLWALATALPEVPIAGGATSTLYLHTAGGVVASVLFWFAVRAYGVRFDRWWQELLALYFFTAGLGVLNELFEFFLSQVGYLYDKGADTWWDLAANTLGTLLAYLVVRVIRAHRT